jgi:hypothetical protein
VVAALGTGGGNVMTRGCPLDRGGVKAVGSVAGVRSLLAELTLLLDCDWLLWCLRAGVICECWGATAVTRPVKC